MRTSAPYAVKDEKRMFAIVRAAFQQRRKTLSNALKNSLGVSGEAARNAILSIGLPEQVRGEVLSVGQFAALSDALEK